MVGVVFGANSLMQYNALAHNIGDAMAMSQSIERSSSMFGSVNLLIYWGL